MPTRSVNLGDPDDRFAEKLAALRGLAAEAFDELDRGEAIVIEGEDALADFISEIGKRAAERVERDSECE
jgi:hypothetical protein